jgi:hypothetical protein
MENINDIREYFNLNYGYVDLEEIDDHVIESFLSRPYLTDLSFVRKMDCLYDYILSQDLCGVEE